VYLYGTIADNSIEFRVKQRLSAELLLTELRERERERESERRKDSGDREWERCVARGLYVSLVVVLLVAPRDTDIIQPAVTNLTLLLLLSYPATE